MSKTTGAPKARPKTLVCRCCGKRRRIELFKKIANGKFERILKSCDAARAREAHRSNAAEINARRRAARARDPERYRKQRRASYWRNIDRERARAREYAKAHPERQLQAVTKWRAKHPDIVAAWEKTHAAVSRGDIKRPAKCQVERCDRKDVHLHHVRYDMDKPRPRDVIALCRNHHEHVHHIGPLRLKEGSGRRWARAPRQDHGRAMNASR